ncbi:9453_t:CDS:2, partial [Cetraspora pellucida]
FGLSITCNPKEPPNFPGFNYSNRRSLLNAGPANVTIMNLTEAIEKDLWLENRWIAEVKNLEQDILNETTIMTVNFVQILALNSICDNGIGIDAGKFKLCYSTIGKNITCFMNTHVENVSSVPAGCSGNCAAVKGWNLVGCVDFNEKNASHVQSRFVELMYGIIASGVMARRSLLSNNGTMKNVKNVEKGICVLGPDNDCTCTFNYSFDHINDQLTSKKLARGTHDGNNTTDGNNWTD